MIMKSLVVYRGLFVLASVVFQLGFLFSSVDGLPWFKRCYKHPPIGCFSIAPPFLNSPFLPDTLEKINMHYIQILDNERLTFPWDTAVKSMKPNFRPDIKTVIIVPGWNESLKKYWIPRLITELQAKEPMNIILVDWTGGALVFSYLQGVSNGRVVAAMIAYFLQGMTEEYGVSPESFHLICNSMGCHVCGAVGHRLKGLGRISAMDPSGRAFDGTSPEVRLDESDAKVVDVIHTDGTNLIGFGSKHPMGTIDFYPNGGHDQPGCPKTVFGILWDMIVVGIGINKCSHTRATLLFIDSINKCNFTGNQCCSAQQAYNNMSSCAECPFSTRKARFGYNLYPKLRGIFTFRTGKLPLC